VLEESLRHARILRSRRSVRTMDLFLADEREVVTT
jgi:hypothetical protein